jgi:ParB-like partition proteins
MKNDWNKKQEPVQLPLGRLHRFPGHPYKVEDNEEMEALTESIQEYGILNPLLVRRVEGSETDYELISGHRRAYAAARAGLETVPAFIVSLDRNEAAIVLVDSNLHRERLLPSEKAFAYKLKMEAMKRQGRRTDLTSCQLGTKLRTDDQIAETADESARQIQRYIRLTNLIPALLDQMDEGRIAFSVGVELSYLPNEAQYDLLDAMERNDCTPSYAQAVRLHRAYNNGTLDRWLIDTTLAEPKPNQQEHIHLKRENFARFFPEHYTAAQIEQDIQAGLELLRRQRDRSRDAR